MSDNTELQLRVDTFNKLYFKATESSKSSDYFEAALSGRHLVNELVKNKFVYDILPALQKNNKKES